MNPVMTNEEFHSACCSLGINNYLPNDYWEKRRYEEEHHPLVGKYAIVTVPNSTIINRKLKVKRANDNHVIFELSSVSELIVNRDGYGWNERDIDSLEWID